MESRFVGITSGLAKATLEDSSIFRIKVNRRDKKIALAYLIYSLENQAKAEWNESSNERIEGLSASKKLIKKLLENPEKLNNIVEVCATSELADVLKLSQLKYILYFSCYSGSYQGGGTFFLFSEEDGLQNSLLRLTELDVHLANRDEANIKEIQVTSEENQVIDGYYYLNEDKKQLYITFRSGGLWNSYNQKRYSFDEDRPVLQEYIYGYQDVNRPQELPFMTERYIRGQQGWFLVERKRCSGVVRPDSQGLGNC